jgi:hypothetical protein
MPLARAPSTSATRTAANTDASAASTDHSTVSSAASNVRGGTATQSTDATPAAIAPRPRSSFVPAANA